MLGSDVFTISNHIVNKKTNQKQIKLKEIKW
jgi:hypothetical protein